MVDESWDGVLTRGFVVFVRRQFALVLVCGILDAPRGVLGRWDAGMLRR